MTTPHTHPAEKMNVASRAIQTGGLLVAALLLLAPAVARAGITYTFTNTTGSGADAYVNYDSRTPSTGNDNHGGYGWPEIKYYTGLGDGVLWSSKSYVRFETTGLADTATSASLILSIDGLGSAGTLNVYGLKDSASGQNWGEGSITWNTAPANDTASNSGLTSEAEFLGTWIVSSNGAQTFSSPNLVTFINADTDHQLTFILTAQAANINVQFDAKEANPAVYPTLSVTVPEPASALTLLLAAGSLALGRRRRACR